MTDEPRWRRYLRFYGHRGVADLDDELRFHVEMRVRDYMARGLSEADARAATTKRFGDLASTHATCAAIATRRDRRLTRTQILGALAQDIRFAGRSLGRHKGWTAVAVLTLALGIGANSAMFSVVNHLLLNPLPYPNADRIVAVRQLPTEGGVAGVSINVMSMGRQVVAWREDTRSFESFEPYKTTDVTIQRAGEVAGIAQTASILPSFAAFTGQRPILGRMFSESEAKGEASVVLLGEGAWRARYGADPGVIGSTISVNEQPFTIIGVAPATFRLPRTSQPTDVWLPLDLVRSDDDGLEVIARLKPGVTRASAEAELDAITQRRGTESKNARFRVHLLAPAELVSFQDSLVLLSAAVALVLLIACANVAHLLLARAATRVREMAIRVAVGAARERIFRQLLTESMILSIAGCIGGLAVGSVGLRLLVAARPESLADLDAARIDASTFLVTAVLSIATGIAFGLVGLVQAVRQSPHDALKTGSPPGSASGSRERARGLLVITEMALCTMLLVGAALLLRSVIHLQNRETGFEPRNLYAIGVQLPGRYNRATRTAFLEELATRAREVPGAIGVSKTSAPPPMMSFLIGAVQLEGQSDPPAGTTGFIPYNGVGPEFFQLMGIRLIEGSTFADTTPTSTEAIVNEGFARKHWPGQSAVGRRLRVVYNGRGEWKTIVGVANNTLMQGLTRDVTEPLLFMPGPGVFQPNLMVRTNGDANAIQRLSSLVMAIDPKLPPPQVTSVERAMQSSIARPRFTMFLLMVFTAIAVGLAAIGLYGVLAYTVAQRTREIGIRIALGASQQKVARLVMSRAIMLTAFGALIGLVAARWGVRLVGTMLYGVHQADTTSFVGGASVLFVIALVACVVPMRRALSVDPLIAMRAD